MSYVTLTSIWIFVADGEGDRGTLGQLGKGEGGGALG